MSLELNKVHFESCITGMEKIQDESVDLLVTDPPFGIDFHKVGSQYNRKQKDLGKNYIEIKNENYYEFTKDWLTQVYRCLKPSGSGFIFSGWNNLRDILNVLEELNLRLVNHIIWKYQFGVYTKKKYVTSHYHVLYFTKVPKSKDKLRTFNKTEYADMQDVWYIKRDYQRGGEKTPTRLPLAVADKCIQFGSMEGNLILDPFIGSGSVAISAIQNLRQYIGFELSPEIFKVATNRITRFTEEFQAKTEERKNLDHFLE